MDNVDHIDIVSPPGACIVNVYYTHYNSISYASIQRLEKKKKGQLRIRRPLADVNHTSPFAVIIFQKSSRVIGRLGNVQQRMDG
jgi:hypothetical protein